MDSSLDAFVQGMTTPHPEWSATSSEEHTHGGGGKAAVRTETTEMGRVLDINLVDLDVLQSSSTQASGRPSLYEYHQQAKALPK